LPGGLFARDPSGEARVARARVEPRQPADIRRRCRIEKLLGPGERFEQLHREAHERGVRGDIGRNFELTAPGAPLTRGTQVAELGRHPVDRITPPRPVPVLPSRHGLPGEVRGVPVWLLMFDVSGHESGNDPLPSVSSEFRLLVNDVAVVVSLHLPFESSDGKAAPRDGVAKCQGRWDTFWPALADKIITTLRG